MKIACQSCGAKYTIADEKVSGKTVKIKCKKCGATVVVDGHAQADGGPGYGNGEAGGDEWTVSVADDDQRTLTTEQIVAEYRNGVVGPDTFVWREGMAEWSALGEVAELASAVGGLGGAQAQVADPPTAAMGGQHAGGGYGMAAAAAAPAAAAVRKRAQSVDLFGGGGAGAMEAAPASSAGSSAHIGERNENSVLFSLSALTAAESAAKKGGGGGAPKPRAPGAPAAKAVTNLDDIMNLGSGGISPGAALAPPPVNAPFIEPPPPPPPPSVHPQMMAGPQSGYGQPSMGGMGMAGSPYGAMGMEQPKKSPMGLIIGGAVGLVVICGAVFALTRGGGDANKDKLATNDTAKTAETKPDKPEKKEEPIAEATKPEETAPPADSAAPPTSAGAAPGAHTGPTPPPTVGGPLPPNTGKKDDPKKEEPKKEEPKEEPKKEEPAAGGGTGSFDRGAAQAALGSAAGGAKGCKKDGGPTGSTKVQVTFAPSGRVTTVSVGPPFAGTPVGSCMASAFKGLSVPPFSGSAVTVSKSVSIK